MYLLLFLEDLTVFDFFTLTLIFQGDILLPKEQIEAIKNGRDPANLVGARGLLKYKEFLWPGGVVYYTIDTRRLKFTIFPTCISERYKAS